MTEYHIDLFNWVMTTQGWQWRLPLIAICIAIIYFFTFGLSDWMNTNDD